MQIVLFDSPSLRKQFLPLSATRPLAELRSGILTIADKWLLSMGTTGEAQYLSEDYLQHKYPRPQGAGPFLYINGALLPDSDAIRHIAALRPGDALFSNSELVAYSAHTNFASTAELLEAIDERSNQWLGATFIQRPEELFLRNAEQIRKDVALLEGRYPKKKLEDPHTQTYGSELFIHAEADVKAATLNSEKGPIYIGKGAQVAEGTIIQGPAAILDGAILKIGSKIRPNTTIGPQCRAGGEISNSLMYANSNKAHDGYLGNSVIGEWCNLGADTNTSNMKNNYGFIKVWDYGTGDFRNTGLQFCGLTMGDHSKAGINTMFNTGTVVGVACNIFGGGFPEKFLPDFSWGGAEGLVEHRLDKAQETAGRMMARRSSTSLEHEQKILEAVFEMTRPLRKSFLAD